MDAKAWENRLLHDYLEGYLFPDKEWLEVSGGSATYWQARLPQTTTVAYLPDEQAKWRVRTRIVESVSRPADALPLCIALNRHAAGWSFAYDDKRQTIEALVSVCAYPSWDAFLLRLAEKSKLSAWMADVIAERLAAEVGGVPAFGFPSNQTEPRREFDKSYYYLETIRSRPEGVMDLTRHVYPPTAEIASYIASFVGVPEEKVGSIDSELRMPVATLDGGEPIWLRGAYESHPIFGAAWHSSLWIGKKTPLATAAEISAMTWGLFDDPHANLLGGWTVEDDHLSFVQWNCMSEVRKQEHLDSYDGRGAGDLWGFTSSLIHPLNALSRVALTGDSTAGKFQRAEERAAWIIDAVAEQARRSVERFLRDADRTPESADRPLLWLRREQIIGIAAWFNPMGPTVSTIEKCSLPDGSQYLVYFQRHPFAPQYRVVGAVESGPELARIQAVATDLLVSGSLPNLLAQWNKPNVSAGDVPPMLRERVLEVARANGDDLVAEAAWIEETMGRPWDFVGHDRAYKEQRLEKAASRETLRTANEAFDRWWRQVSDLDNFVANFIHLPDAWDGAINSQRAYGNTQLFDTGPLLLTYSDIGLPEDGPRGTSPSDADSGEPDLAKEAREIAKLTARWIGGASRVAAKKGAEKLRDRLNRRT